MTGDDAAVEARRPARSAAAVDERPAGAPVLGALATGGIAARFVGGCVRNAVLNRPIDDIDIAIDSRPRR